MTKEEIAIKALENMKNGACCGSASHCYCARDLDRRFIGIELDKNYFEVGKNRMAYTSDFLF